MKSTRLLVEGLLVAVCVASWGHMVNGVLGVSASVRAYTQQAEEYRGQRLYELSLENYQKALAVKPSKQLYEDIVSTAEEYYEETHTTAVRRTVESAYADAVKAYPRESAYWEGYAALYMDAEDYSGAVKILEKAQNNHASSEGMTAQWNQAYYASKVSRQRYREMSLACDGGMFLVQTDELWGALDAGGSEKIGALYTAISPAGEGGAVLCTAQDGEQLLYNASGKLIGRFMADIEESRGYGDGLIPVRLAGRSDWCYLNAAGQEQFGGFQQAGMFQNGKAAVQLSTGDWCLIGTDGQQSGGDVWQEVRLDGRGAYMTSQRMLAKTNGSWNIYDSKGKVQGNLSADNVDINRGGLIAFEQNGKWGYADSEGNAVIEPCYTLARSFSGGVGAVYNGAGWGFITEDGLLVVEYQFQDAGYFSSSGSCPVRQEEMGDWQLLSWSVQH